VNDEVEPLQLQEADIAAAIKSFPAGSAGGLDGLRPQHIKDMVGTQTAAVGQRLVASLTDFTNAVLSGHVPKVVRPVFCGASLCALSKKMAAFDPSLSSALFAVSSLRRPATRSAKKLLSV
jgi:hypothetical protein